VSHLATFATLCLAVEVHARTGHAEREICKVEELGHVVRRAEKVEHGGGGYVERGRADGEGEDGAEMIFVLGGLARFDGVMARVVRSRRDLVHEDLAF
jgi:hypothetical protein